MTREVQSVDLLIQRAEALRHTDFNAVIALGAEIYTRALPLEYWHGCAMGLFYSAWGHLRLGNYAEAVKPATEARRLAQTHGLEIEEAYSLSVLSAIYAAVDDPQEALELLLRQQQIAEAHQHIELLASALQDLAVTYDDLAKHERAAHYYRAALEQADQHDLLYVKTFGLLNFALHHIDLGEQETALRLCLDALALAKQHQFRDQEVRVLQILALLGTENVPAALFEESVHIAQELGEGLEGQALTHISRWYLEHHQHRRALQAAQRALTLSLAHNNNQYTIHNHRYLAAIYEAMGDYAQALHHLREYSEVRKKLFDERQQAQMNVLLSLHEVESAQREAQMHRLRLQTAEREHAERLQVERLHVSLEKERELMHVKEHILQRVSHEFRTPLSIIRSSMELLTRYAERITPEQRSTHQARIDANFEVINRILNDISAVLRAGSVDPQIRPASANLHNICEQAIYHASQQTWNYNRIHLTLDSDSDTILTDEHMLREIIMQLLSNALKFSTEMVELEVRFQAASLHITVRDQGIGIPPEDLPHVFKPLFRGSNLDEVPGSGLGLAVVQHYVTLLCGSIHLESTPQVGTTALVRIPAE
jgi:signal transduction histidine kinase